MPMEYPPARWRAAAGMPTSSSISSTRRWLTPAVSAMTRRWLRPERPGWKLVASSAAPTTRCGACRWVYEWPPIVALPLVGRTRPSNIRNVVVFPAPLGPRKPVIRPGSTEKLRLLTAVREPNFLVRSRTCTWVSCLESSVIGPPLVLHPHSQPRRGRVSAGGSLQVRPGSASSGQTARIPAQEARGGVPAVEQCADRRDQGQTRTEHEWARVIGAGGRPRPVRDDDGGRNGAHSWEGGCGRGCRWRGGGGRRRGRGRFRDCRAGDVGDDAGRAPHRRPAHVPAAVALVDHDRDGGADPGALVDRAVHRAAAAVAGAVALGDRGAADGAGLAA